MNFTHKAATLFLIALLCACTKAPYDFSGTYVSTRGDDCSPIPGENAVLSIFPAPGGEGIFSAKLNSAMASWGWPTDSKISKISEDESIIFSFSKDATIGFLISQPSVDIRIKVIKKDKDHLLIESWPITITNPVNPSKSSSFNFIKDSKVNIMGNLVDNPMSMLAGKKGLCVVREKL